MNQIFQANGFDRFVEKRCDKFYAKTMGRPSLPPAVYFRLRLMGYFEGIDCERVISRRIADSMALPRFLADPLIDQTADHSALSRNRGLIDLDTHAAVFVWVLPLLAKEKLLDGRTLGIDATPMEANAGLGSIVRRDSGESC